MLGRIKAYFRDPEVIDVARVHNKFNLGIQFIPHLLERKSMLARKDFLKEEMEEFHNAIDQENLAAAIDALIDIVVVAKGTAVMMGIRWKPHWDEVHRANMGKVRGVNAKRPDMPTDLIKPEGWVPPDHHKILNRTGW